MTKDYPGQQTLDTQNTEQNVHQFMVDLMMGKACHVTLVQVQSCSVAGVVGPVGRVSVKPLVNMIDGIGTNYKHGVINDIPYFRLQGGSGKAVILDPKKDDIGVLISADRDISAVKKNKAQSSPGSYRRFDMADGLFFPCFLGGTPTCYVRFTDDNKIIISPDNGTTVITIEAGRITLSVSGTVIVLRAGRIDLGQIDAPNAVVTTAGPSSVVWAVI